MVVTKQIIEALFKRNTIDRISKVCDYCGKDLFENDRVVVLWYRQTAHYFHGVCALEYGSNLIIDSGKCKELNKEDLIKQESKTN